LAGLEPDLRLLLVVASDPLVPPLCAAEAAARLAEPGLRLLAQGIGIVAETSVRRSNADAFARSLPRVGVGMRDI
jgi:hypothetical protein